MQAQQQAYADAQRARMEQAQARARADAQARQSQLLAEQERRNRQLRSEALTKSRMERRVAHRVSRTDTPETIASMYGTTPQSVVERSGVPRLRAGQVIPVYQPVGPSRGQRKAEDLMPSAPTVGQRKAEDTGIVAQPAPAVSPFASAVGGFAGRVGDVFSPTADALGRQTGLWDVPEPRNPLTEMPDERTGYMSQQQVQQNMSEVPMSEAQRANFNWALTDRWTGQAVNYVYGMIESGQMSIEEGRNIFRNTVMVKNPDGSYRYELGDKWMTFSTAEFAMLSPTTQEKLRDLGWVDNGLGQVVPLLLEEPDYGMGGFEYPSGGGYGFGGGGGGGYEPVPRTGTRISRRSGGSIRPQRERLTVGAIPRTHWRI